MTSEGEIGVWGKANLDPQLETVTPNAMVRVTFTGRKKTGKGTPMYTYLVEQDRSNIYDDSPNAEFDALDEAYDDENEAALDEPTLAAPKTNKATLNVQQAQANARAALSKNRAKSA